MDRMSPVDPWNVCDSCKPKQSCFSKPCLSLCLRPSHVLCFGAIYLRFAGNVSLFLFQETRHDMSTYISMDVIVQHHVPHHHFPLHPWRHTGNACLLLCSALGSSEKVTANMHWHLQLLMTVFFSSQRGNPPTLILTCFLIGLLLVVPSSPYSHHWCPQSPNCWQPGSAGFFWATWDMLSKPVLTFGHEDPSNGITGRADQHGCSPQLASNTRKKPDTWPQDQRAQKEAICFSRRWNHAALISLHRGRPNCAVHNANCCSDPGFHGATHCLYHLRAEMRII